MKKRSVILIATIVILPLLLLTWATLRLARNEQTVIQQQFRELMQQRLDEINQTIVRHFAETQRQLLQLTALDDPDTESLRELNRRDPRVLQLFVLAPDGQLRYPDPAQELNSSEQSFLLRAARMFTDQDLKSAVALAEEQRDSDRGDTGMTSRLDVDQLQYQQAAKSSAQQPGVIPASGWFVWYWDRGLNLICWQRRPGGEIVGAALERARWMADLIAILPETESDARGKSVHGSVASRIRLVDPAADVVYQWGHLPDNERHTQPLCEIPVSAPLSTWRLQCVVPASSLAAGSRSSFFVSLIGGLIATAVSLAVLGILLLRDYSRDMQRAAQQVSFVNQVSHELKTPLTNIRMYAELLQHDLEEMPPSEITHPQQRLNVILSEGQRLSRLIGNVLTFARQNRQHLQPQFQSHVPDQLIHFIVDRFRPSLTSLGIDVQLDCHADQRMSLDADFFEQILGNVISNVEKYAAAGGLLRIQSTLSDGMLTVDVTDAGPGLADSECESIFLPFYRLSHDVSYAAGTGIGLTIARQLARLHGGDVKLMESDQGCRFRICLKGKGLHENKFDNDSSQGSGAPVT